MTWDQIREVESEEFAFIGHHSHTHDYLIDETNDKFILDIEKANEIFLKELRIYTKFIFLSFWWILKIYERLYF